MSYGVTGGPQLPVDRTAAAARSFCSSAGFGGWSHVAQPTPPHSRAVSSPRITATRLMRPPCAYTSPSPTRHDLDTHGDLHETKHVLDAHGALLAALTDWQSRAPHR